MRRCPAPTPQDLRELAAHIRAFRQALESLALLFLESQKEEEKEQAQNLDKAGEGA